MGTHPPLGLLKKPSDKLMIDFLGIGAQKAGTTWLYDKMRRHPNVGFPAGKEVHFWDNQHSRGVQWYQSLFATDRKPGKKIGEITPSYSILPLQRIRECCKHFPDLRLIYLLRSPIDRAWSAAKMALENSQMTINEASEQWFLDHFRSSGSRMRGHYARCIANWATAYPKEQLHLCFFDDLVANPADLLRGCFQHIGVDDSQYDWSNNLSTKVFKSLDHELPDRLRYELEQIYLPEIAALEQMLDVDLSAWRQRLSKRA